MPVKKICERCGTEYTCRPSKASERKYCGAECARLGRITYTDRENLSTQYEKAWAKKNPANAKKVRENSFNTYYNTIGGRAEHLLNNAKGRAKRIGVAVTLPKDWITSKLETGTCEVTGIPFMLQSNSGKGHKENSFSPSIDRINQTGDYSPENCRLVVWIYNRARGAFPDSDFDRMTEALRKV